jgi:hypothetical protein
VASRLREAQTPQASHKQGKREQISDPYASESRTNVGEDNVTQTDTHECLDLFGYLPHVSGGDPLGEEFGSRNTARLIKMRRSYLTGKEMRHAQSGSKRMPQSMPFPKRGRKR